MQILKNSEKFSYLHMDKQSFFLLPVEKYEKEKQITYQKEQCDLEYPEIKSS